MKLWAHQERAIEFARSHANVAMFYSPGTGKTGATIRILCDEYNRARDVEPTLIFAPLSVCPQWAVEFGRFSKISPERVLVLTGTGASRVKKLNAAIASGKRFIVVTNYEGLRIGPFREALARWQPKLLVCDESHRLKDASSQTNKYVRAVSAHARRRFLLTGTPVLNSLLDLFGQYLVMDSRIFGESFWRFRQTHFYDANAGMPSHVHFPKWLPRPEAAQNIARVLAVSSVQARKEECLDLPPLVKAPVVVALGSAQGKAYEMMKKHFVAEVKDAVAVAEFAMTKTLRLQQILAGFVQDDESGEVKWFDENPRLDAYEELLETIGPDQKVIVWTTFQPTYNKLEAIAQKLGRKTAQLTGLQTTAQKQLAIEAFTKGDVQVLISNPSAGGTGINLVEAAYSIYYMRGYSLEHYLQSEARNFRGGSEMHQKITHYELEATGTLDEVIGKALAAKQNVGETVLKWAKGVDK